MIQVQFRSLLLIVVSALMVTMSGCGQNETNRSQTSAGQVFVQLPDFTALVAKSSPAVVNISTTRAMKRDERGLPGLNEEMLEEWFERFFGGPNQRRPQGPPSMPAESLGSGFIVSTDGDILTNYHVVAEADEIVVKLSDRRQFTAEIVGHDKQSDLALLHIEADDLPVASIGDSDALAVGEWVLAIGSPFGFDHSVTAGIVSAKQRSLNTEQYVPFIQTDVAINPGNSGGPLFNLRGEVVGVNSQIFSRSGGYMGLSFAIPINVAMQAVTQLRDQGFVSRGWLGVVVQEVTRDLAESFGLSRPEGALVVKVMPDSPAEEAGVEVGDVIMQFNGESVDRSASLPVLVGQAPPGKKATLTVLRDGKRRELELRPGELAKQDLSHEGLMTEPESALSSLFGFEFEDLTPGQRKEAGIEQGAVVVTEVRQGPAADAGLRPNDILLRWGAASIKSADHLKQLIGDTGQEGTVAILAQRDGQQRFLALKFDE